MSSTETYKNAKRMGFTEKKMTQFNDHIESIRANVAKCEGKSPNEEATMPNCKQKPSSLKALIGSTALIMSLPIMTFSQESAEGGSAVWTYTPDVEDVVVRVKRCEVDDSAVQDGVLTWDDTNEANPVFNGDQFLLSFVQEGANEIVLSTDWQLENLDGGDPIEIISIDAVRVTLEEVGGSFQRDFDFFEMIRTDAGRSLPSLGSVLGVSTSTNEDVSSAGVGSATLGLRVEGIRVSDSYDPDADDDRYRFTITLTCNFPTGDS